MSLKIATWNVNSLRVRLPHVLDWLASAQPDILALQETKTPDADFSIEEIQQAGYHVVFSGQRTYNGMAVISREVGKDIITDLPGMNDPQRRVLALTIGQYRIINLYVPNGESVGSEKYLYKLEWLSKLEAFLKEELKNHPNIIILGDFNIAPEDRDVHDPAEWIGKVLCSDLEREALQRIIQLGFSDCFRLTEQVEKSFSWWDYRMNAFKRNRGLRIDHILTSAPLTKKCKNCSIDKGPRGLERPSDHTPVIAEFDE